MQREHETDPATDPTVRDPARGDLSGEDLSRGPTPETRQTMRATDDDDAAAAQPGADRETRADVGGNQDTDLTRPVDPDRRDDPDLRDPALRRDDADVLERDEPGTDPTVR